MSAGLNPMDHESWAEIKPSILDLLRCIEKEQVARREKAKDDDNSDEDWNEEWVGDDGSADEALGTDAVDSDGY
ncbi:hypothetical protein GLOTRDRAFT_131211 [Gloeophyllum trabeum ATCC 11539]|uniref:Uncharacterized protein n=1 Tax=Gloeophyllum trabeum (strain ATCC 11539 / FP-39264 / Madison 617) TaxID=670483 RepID=S7RFE4_GLOTA|nr:uncharacterized protein GLOTRDRAFT_131211 [Gloeophyllum trabeum ATCC 11539]EPQ52920.1 hypothetical protein GLOTRDRAFT_131211 [Gloeophyllum trabeum ATCC 11539]